MTVKTYPDAVVSGLKLSLLKADNANSSAAVFSAVDEFHAALPDLVNFGTMVIYYFTDEYLTVSALTAFNKTQAELEEAMQPVLGSFDSLNLTYTLNYTESDTYLDHYEYYWGPLPEGWIQVGTDQFGGRLISTAQLCVALFLLAVYRIFWHRPKRSSNSTWSHTLTDLIKVQLLLTGSCNCKPQRHFHRCCD